MINALILILTAHLIADFPLQNKFVSIKKCDTFEYMMIHCLIYAGVLTIALNQIGIGWWVFLPLLVSHAIVDYYGACKVQLTLWQDQLLHLIVIGVLCIL
jgi:hypothetical protein